MLRLPVKMGRILRLPGLRLKSSGSIRSSFIEYFQEHGHKQVKSSSVVPLYDPTVPFVNAGMNQFKGIFLGKLAAPYPRVVNYQKCVRVGGKHNDLEVVGKDGHHHTFFEMLGSWSFGNYYKKEACQMAWDLLLGPYRLKPEQLLVTYFQGDATIKLTEDKECRDIWRSIGVPDSRLKALDSKHNFWEMGATGPCGPCTEIHYMSPNGSLTEIWNLVFINYSRDENGHVKELPSSHVDTGMGLERMATILQGVQTNYDTDLFQPIIKAIEKNSKAVNPYSGKFTATDTLDQAYRRLADHSRMISICLADGVFPASSLNLRQIVRKSLKICTDVFQNPKLLRILYDKVTETLRDAYPELHTKAREAHIILDHEEQSYLKLRAGLNKKLKEMKRVHPEVEELADVELPSFALGYHDFKETMTKQKSNKIPGELVFKLYDTYGFQEDIIDRIAALNKLEIDKKRFWQLLAQHKARHKAAYKEQTSTRALRFAEVIKDLKKNGHTFTNDKAKYDYIAENGTIQFPTVKTKLLAILNKDLTWVDILDPCENEPYYIVTKETNFFCEEGGQLGDEGIIYVRDNVALQVDSVFKIQDFVFHKGYFGFDKSGSHYVYRGRYVELEINEGKRLNLMKNHTAVHLLNAAIRRVLLNSVVCTISSKVLESGLSLSLSVYGQKLTQNKILDAQALVRDSIQVNAPVEIRVVDSIALANEDSVVTIPGEIYPDVGLRLVMAHPPLLSKELCCGTHVPRTGFIEELCITMVKGAGSHTPTIHAVTGQLAKQVRELFSRAEKLEQFIELIEPQRKREEVALIKKNLSELCGTSGAPYGEYAECLKRLDKCENIEVNTNELTLQTIADTEVRDAISEAMQSGRKFVVHFLRCSYLMQSSAVQNLLATPQPVPTLILGCAGGVIVAGTSVPQNLVSDTFTAKNWLSCILPVFSAEVLPSQSRDPNTFAEMSATKVSLINCEQLVQDAMRIAIKFAQSHIKEKSENPPTQNRQQN